MLIGRCSGDGRINASGFVSGRAIILARITGHAEAFIVCFLSCHSWLSFRFDFS